MQGWLLTVPTTPSKTNTDARLFFPSIMFQACEIPRREIQRGRGEGILERKVLNHHCGGAAGPTYRKPHLEANRRIARARKKYMMRIAPREAATAKGTMSTVTAANCSWCVVDYTYITSWLCMYGRTHQQTQSEVVNRTGRIRRDLALQESKKQMTGALTGVRGLH